MKQSLTLSLSFVCMCQCVLLGWGDFVTLLVELTLSFWGPQLLVILLLLNLHHVISSPAPRYCPEIQGHLHDESPLAQASYHLALVLSMCWDFKPAVTFQGSWTLASPGLGIPGLASR